MPQTLELDSKTTVPQQTLTAARARRGLGKRAFFTLLLAALAVVGSWLALQYYASAISYESTDDAFIDGHIISVSSKVADRVSGVKFNDNQNVKKGDVLVELDPRDFAAAANQKKAALDSVQAQRGAAQASLQEAIDHVNTLQATVQQDQASANASQAEAERTASDLRRYEDLFKQKVVSIQDLDNARAAARSAAANLQSAQKKVTADQASVVEAQARVNTIIALLQSVAAQVQESDANLETARLNQSYTVITAPEDGRISHKSVEPGDYIQAGQNLTALVPEKIWVTANFKEDQIGLMRPGQPAEIKIDALHGRTFQAHVDSIQAGSGARFSLLPPENATGNYVKVVQRVPVKIVFDEQPESGLPLGPGESVVPRVQVQDFHLSWLDLAVYAAILALVVGLILWLGLRPSRKN